ncbi:hypothetical protein [Novosphingobium kaempferiae]|uniref:hypothetical protein n=1 Tax=Novosphingobium kaempferiae TaxID=2896849 RepID=UPI001E2B1F42|nr:hypothetical protein [Novosphingobium kaempferiae]
MARLWRFMNADTAFDVARAIEASATLKRLKTRLSRLHGTAGGEMVEDMVVWVMRHAGDHYVTVRGRQIDKVLRLRLELEAIYKKVMRFGDDAPSKADLDGNFARLAKKYKEIDAALADAAKPLEPFVLPPAAQDELARKFHDALTGSGRSPLTAFAEQGTQSTPRPHAADFLDSRGRAPGDKGYRLRDSRAGRKEWVEDPKRPGVYRRAFDGDGSTGELRVVDNRYELTSVQADGTSITIREEQVSIDPYARKVSTTSLLNAHHGVQSHPMKEVFGDFGYDPDAAPTIWLRNSRAGSPHGRITAIEGRTGLHPTEPGSRMTPGQIAKATYADMRHTAAAEMKTVGISDKAIREYLAAHDRYFIDRILPNMTQAERKALLGGWTEQMAGIVP